MCVEQSKYRIASWLHCGQQNQKHKNPKSECNLVTFHFLHRIIVILIAIFWNHVVYGVAAVLTRRSSRCLLRNCVAFFFFLKCQSRNK